MNGSYEKQTWTTGDVITAEKLNHIEEGIESGIGTATLTLNVHNESSNGTIRVLYYIPNVDFETGDIIGASQTVTVAASSTVQLTLAIPMISNGSTSFNDPRPNLNEGTDYGDTAWTMSGNISLDHTNECYVATGDCVIDAYFKDLGFQ